MASPQEQPHTELRIEIPIVPCNDCTVMPIVADNDCTVMPIVADNDCSVIPIVADNEYNAMQSSDGCISSASSPPKCSADSVDDVNELLLNELDGVLQTHHCCDNASQICPTNISNDLQKQYDLLQNLYFERQNYVERLLVEVEQLRHQCSEQDQQTNEYQKHIERFRMQNEELTGEFNEKRAQLEHSIEEYQKQVEELKQQFNTREAQAKKYYQGLQTDLQARLSQVTRAYEETQKEKQDMVVKYAVAEQKNIEVQEKMNKMDKKMKEMEREKDQALNKCKQVKNEQQRTEELYQARNMEVVNVRRDVERLKELRAESEAKAKSCSSVLKSEQEAHRVTRGKLEDAVKKLKQSREEVDNMRRECDLLIKQYQQIDSCSPVHAEGTESSEQVHTVIRGQLETLKTKHKDMLEELKTYKDRVTCLEAERLHQEETLNKFKDTLQGQKKENKTMEVRLKELSSIEERMLSAERALEAMNRKMEEVEELNRDLHSDIEACALRESEHLKFANMMSDQNAALQAQNSALESQIDILEKKFEELSVQLQDKDGECQVLANKMELEKQHRIEDTGILRTKLEEKSRLVTELSQQFEDQKDENKTLKKRHIANVKDLTRQLQQAKRRLDQSDSNGQEGSMGSRTSSNTSLDTIANSLRPTVESSASQEFDAPIVQFVEVDKQALVEKIVRLQRAHARKNEKIEFLEEHVGQLLEELKKKSKLIQNYVCREETGSLTPESVDIHKAQMSNKLGIMASLYTSHAKDGHMTLDFALEISNKLQAVLEDTLLKNITLKENLDTLGREIARLSQENRELQLTLHGHK